MDMCGICVGYVWCDGYVWDMCGVRYANNLLKNLRRNVFREKKLCLVDDP